MRLTGTSVLLACLLSGCSATQRVSENANAIRSESSALIQHGTETGDKEVVSRAERIYELAADIHERIPHMEDRTPQWVSALLWGGIAVASVAVVIVLWQTGIGTAIRVAVGWLPRRKVNDAELAAGMLDASSPEDAREYVAARRASDPEFDAAWRRLKKRKSNDSDSR